VVIETCGLLASAPMASRFRLSALLLLIALPACNGPPAPEQAGVCWRAQPGGAGRAAFKPLASDVGSLENCAVLLEGLRLQGAAEADGAYQGYFIFVGPDAMTSALHTHGVRYPIFQPPQRRVIDRDLRRMMAERGGKMPDASEIGIERR
jgi:hypothetical protein